MRLSIALRGLLVAVLLAGIALPIAATGVTYTFANTTLGTVRGQIANNTRVFKGIPFGATTGGSNRFLPPQPVASWQGTVRDALEFGPGCVQTHHNPDVPEPQSEDCLSLNVWAPVDSSPSTRYAVQVWIYGGGFAEGGGSLDLYDGAHLTSTSSNLIVTLNYRLGSFGWLTTETISGNFGLMDQRAALQWVQDNIANFGGDPRNVTLFGESAGAMSTGIHIISPLSKGLFHRAIMESNPASWRYKDAKHGAAEGSYFLKGANCSDDLACLQALTTDQVIAAAAVAENAIFSYLRENWGHFLDGLLPWTPTFDGSDQFPMQLMDAISSGQFNHPMEVILGTNENEGQTFILGSFSSPLPADEADALVLALFEPLSDGLKVVKFYDFQGSDTREQVSQLVTDYLFRCSSRRLAQLFVKQNITTYLYHYDHVLSFDPWQGYLPYCVNITCHAAELPMVWHNTLNWTFDAQEEQLSDQFVSYWTSFAAVGNPNAGDTSVVWPAFEVETQPDLLLQTPNVVVEATENDAACSFWDNVINRYNF